MAFDFRRLLGKEEEDDYVEIDLDASRTEESKVIVKTFVLKNFDGINEILNSLREGYTIALIDIKPLKTKDVIELKRAVSKIKKTVEAMEGNIAGFGENTIIATPQFADIHRPMVERKSEREKADFIK
jgi:SepF-like predicted cell division protein (DUF552 family)